RANLRLVVNIARGFAGKGLSMQDLIEEGFLGLSRSVDGFDPSKHCRFSTYASYWIRQSMNRAIKNQGQDIRKPAYMSDLLSKWRHVSHELQEELGRPPAEKEIVERLGISQKRLELIRSALRTHTASSQGAKENDELPLAELTESREHSP